MVYEVLNNTEMLYVFVSVYNSVQQVWALCVTWWVSYKKQELLILREHLGSPPVFGVESVLLIFFRFLCRVVWFFLFFLSSSCVLCVQCYQCLYCPFLIVFVPCVVCPMLPVSVLSILDFLRPVCCVPNVTSVCIVNS